MKKLCLTVLALCLFTLPTFSASWEVQDARKYYTNGQYSQALKNITSAIEGSNSNDPVAYDLRAKIYLKMNSPVSALKDLTKAIEILDNNGVYESETVYKIFELANKKGDIYLQQKDYDKALIEYCYVISNKKYIPNLNRDKAIFIRDTSEKNLKNFINNKTIPDFPRTTAAYFLSLFYEGYYGTSSKKYIAAGVKLLQIIANADENCEYFAQKPKEKVMAEFKSNFYSSEEWLQGLYEYAIGNKVTGMKIVQGVLNETKARDGVNSYNEIKEYVDYILNVLDNGI